MKNNNLNMSAKLIAVTSPRVAGVENAEQLIAYAARVSAPQNQMSHATAPKLLKYCLSHGHYSVFETASMTVEIKTTRAIAAQVLRHRSFTFQEFSQRYAKVDVTIPSVEARLQDTKNRQNSIKTDDIELHQWFSDEQQKLYEKSVELYENAIEKGVAKESARFVLPLATPTTLYMTGDVRSWIFYIKLRSSNGTQREHADIAASVQQIFKNEFPNISEALGW
jgi:thymidylate synthase (FAD)